MCEESQNVPPMGYCEIPLEWPRAVVRIVVVLDTLCKATVRVLLRIIDIHLDLPATPS